MRRCRTSLATNLRVLASSKVSAPHSHRACGSVSSTCVLADTAGHVWYGVHGVYRLASKVGNYNTNPRAAHKSVTWRSNACMLRQLST